MKSSVSRSSPSKKYKALMLDVDGTTVRNSFDAMPSEKVKKSVIRAHSKIKIGLATSRPFWHVRHIIEDLKINSPCIVAGGSQIFDPQKNKVVWEKLIDVKDIKPIFEISERLRIVIAGDGEGKDIAKKKINIKDYKEKGPLQFWIPNLNFDLAEHFIDELSDIPTIAALKLFSWKPGVVDVLISHAQATKQHGIIEVAKLLNIQTHEIIGVGDGYNDFPLLMACGLKIAMGNADEELKKIADFVAPSVEEDGAATVIDKFIL